MGAAVAAAVAVAVAVAVAGLDFAAETWPEPATLGVAFAADILFV